MQETHKITILEKLISMHEKYQLIREYGPLIDHNVPCEMNAY